MSLTEVREKIVAEIKVRRVALISVFMAGLVGVVSADTFINASISPIVVGLTLLFTPLLAVVVAAVPVIVTIAIVAFILGILSMILGKLR